MARSVFAAFCLMVWVGLAPAVQARDLPQGGFMLVDTPLSGIAEGEIVPVFLHVEITATRLDWTFITGFMPFDQSCEMYQKCQQSVQTLSHEVDWQADGTLAILKTERRRGAELTIDRPAEDEIFVYEALSLFLDGAVLDLDASGGLLRREPQEGKQEGETVVRLLPATLDHGLAALAFARAFELPLALLDHCVIRQVVGFAAMAEPDPLTQEVLLAARFLRYLDTLDLEAHFYSGEPPAEKGFDVQMAKLRGTAARFTLGTVSQMYGDAARSGAVPPTDADALVAATQIIARLQKRLGDFYGVVVEEIVQTRGQELLAAARFEARRAAVSEASQEAMIARVCTDARLP